MASDQEIMIWGRWSSDSYKSYTRLKHEAKLAIFKKIVKVFNLWNKIFVLKKTQKRVLFSFLTYSTKFLAYYS